MFRSGSPTNGTRNPKSGISENAKIIMLRVCNLARSGVPKTMGLLSPTGGAALERVVYEMKTDSKGVEALFAAVADSSGDAIYSKDLSGRITSWNKAAERIFGYQAGEIIGHSSDALLPPELAQEEAKMLQRIESGETVCAYDTIRLRKDGSRVAMTLRSAGIRDSARNLVGLSTIARDLGDEPGAAERLRRSEERFRLTLSSIGDAVISTDRLGQVSFMNRVAEELTGWPEKGAAGKPLREIFQIINEQSRREVENPVEKVLESGAIVGLGNHTILISKEGIERPIDDSAAPIHSLDGTVAGVVLVFRDISERRAAEYATQRLAAIVESSDDAIIAKDLKGVVTHWNKGAERIFGYTPGEMVGQSITKIIPADRQEEEQQILSELQAGRRVEHFETIRLAKDGHTLRVSVSISPVRGPEGEIVGASKIARDMTQQKKAEEARQHLAAIVESCEDAILSMSLDGTLESWNGAAQRIYGYSEQEVVGRSINLLIPMGLRKEEKNILARVRSGERINHYETRRVTRTGREIDVSLTISPVRDSSGTIVALSKIARDITGQKAAQRALESAQRELKRHAEELEQKIHERTARLQESIAELEAFSYSLSHDMRAPLRAIQSFSEIVMEDYGDKLDAEGLSHLKKITSAAVRMDQLLQDVLTFTQVSRQEIILETVDVDKLAREMVQERPELQPPRAEVVVESPLRPMLGHRASLTQCLSNLLSNGVKFVAPGVLPRVRVYTELVGSAVRLWVEDNGIGIAPEALHRLFGMFQRLNLRQEYEGTGVGLAIVRKAAERMHGEAGVESEVGKGSRFWLQLPGAPRP